MPYPEACIYWAQRLGANPDSLAQLAGGMNSLLYKCSSLEASWVVKQYPQSSSDASKRMQAELDFLIYCSVASPLNVAELVQVDYARRCLILKYINGSSCPEGVSPSISQLKDAFKFFRDLNENKDLAKEHVSANAKDSFVALLSHVELIESRISMMSTDHIESGRRIFASSLLDQIKTHSYNVKIMVDKEINDGSVSDLIDLNDLCISPSDFGFHNAIITADKTIFIDFEFSGWDDPAKTCIDFVLQPRNPVNISLASACSSFFPDVKNLYSRRTALLLKILDLKWKIIILGLFNRERCQSLLNLASDIQQAQLEIQQFERYKAYKFSSDKVLSSCHEHFPDLFPT